MKWFTDVREPKDTSLKRGVNERKAVQAYMRTARRAVPTWAWAGCTLGLCLGSGTLWAGAINIPNASFESPATVFVNTHVDSWQKVEKPEWYVEGGGYTWDQLVGIFKNTAPGSTDHIGNCDGNQAIWIFAIPEMGLFQDYDSTDWANPVPTHEFDAVFQPGKSYELTVGVIGGGGNMLPGVTLELSLYYRDAASNQVVVAATTITNGLATFPDTTNFVDFRVEVPTVGAGDAWAGQHIGIRLLSTVSQESQGGYWDVDNIRLVEVPGPTLANATWSNGVFSASLQSKPGLRFEILSSSDPASPVSGWTSRGYLTNATGSATFTDSTASPVQRFYLARQLP